MLPGKPRGWRSKLKLLVEQTNVKILENEMKEWARERKKGKRVEFVNSGNAITMTGFSFRIDEKVTLEGEEHFRS